MISLPPPLIALLAISPSPPPHHCAAAICTTTFITNHSPNTPSVALLFAMRANRQDKRTISGLRSAVHGCTQPCVKYVLVDPDGAHTLTPTWVSADLMPAVDIGLLTSDTPWGYCTVASCVPSSEGCSLRIFLSHSSSLPSGRNVTTWELAPTCLNIPGPRYNGAHRSFFRLDSSWHDSVHILVRNAHTISERRAIDSSVHTWSVISNSIIKYAWLDAVSVVYRG
jgi:hypothetical protein